MADRRTYIFFFSSRRRHTRWPRDWSSDVCSSDLSLVWMSARATPGAQPAAAELVLTNGKIVTVDARDSVAQAIAIADGRIVAVGTNDEIRSRVGPSTRVVDLRGRTATPGLIDTHVHFTEVDELYSVNLGVVEVKSVDDA